MCLGRREYVELCCSNPSVSGVVCVFRSERIRRVVLFKSFCFWGCVCLGRREYVELGCGVQILLFLGLCVFRSERIRRVVLRCSNPSVSGVVCV